MRLNVPEELSYIGVFLSLRCFFGCSYCINKLDGLKYRKELSVNEWIQGLNSLAYGREKMVPITIQGGEPSVHPGFIEIIKNLASNIYIDMLTNLDFDVDRFMKEIAPEKLQRDVPYASIRVSYHPEFSDLSTLLAKIVYMQNQGYSIGLFAVDHPKVDIQNIRNKAEAVGIDFRTKEFLGKHNGRMYGSYKYSDACAGNELKMVRCKTTELLIAPDGSVHKCHRDLYKGEYPLGNILDENNKIEFVFRDCDTYGECNPCDIKMKNNRFQQFGHCSMEIKL